MAHLKRAFRTAGLLAVVLWTLLPAGCSSESTDSGPLNTCSRVDGVWNVSLDYGNGLLGKQTWTIAQVGCDLTLTGEPPDQYGPALPGTVTGYAGDGNLFANWTNTWDACRYYSRLDATVTGNTLSGTIGWVRNAYGAGYCAAAIGEVAVTGSRP